MDFIPEMWFPEKFAKYSSSATVISSRYLKGYSTKNCAQFGNRYKSGGAKSGE